MFATRMILRRRQLPSCREVGKASICACYSARSTRYRFDPKAIIDSTAKPLLTTEVFLRRLDGYMTE